MSIVQTRAIRRVIELLDERQVVVITAPVGFGKTTTARAAVAERPGSVWYGAQSWERDAFIGALVDAVRGARPDFGRLTLGLAESGAEPARLGASFARDLTHVHEPLTIVIDDAHLLWEGERFSPFLDAMLSRAPAYVRLLLASRTAPHFNLMELVAAERAAIVPADDLRFSAIEAETFARDAGAPVEPAEVKRIVEELDGWPAGLALRFRFGGREFPSSIGSLDAVSAYLLERLIGTMPAGGLEALEAVCVLETVELELFDEPQRSALRAQLTDLEQRGALVATLRTGEQFRIHPLLRDALRKRVRARGGAEAIAALHERAARAYAASRRARPALFHLAKADSDDAYLGFLRTGADDAIGGGLGDALGEIVARLRARSYDDPVLDYVGGLLAKPRGGDGELRAAFALARERALERGDEATAYLSEVQLVEHDLGRGRPVQAEILGDLLLRGARRGPMDGALAAIRSGWYEAVGGRFARALEAVANVPDDGSSIAAFNLVPLRAYAHTALGEFEASSRLMAALLERLSDGETIVLYAIALIWASRLALLRGDTNEAYDYALQARRAGDPFGLRHEQAALYAALAESAVHGGDPALAADASKAARRAARDAWYVRDAERATGFSGLYEARAAFLAGDAERALELAAGRAGDSATPLLRALARADEHVFAATLGARRTAEERAALLADITASAPADAADAVALDQAADLIGFFEALEGGGGGGPVVWTHPFAALIERRNASRLAPAGSALRALRTGRAGAEGFVKMVRAYAARGPRYEIAVVLAAARPQAEQLRPALTEVVAAYRGAVAIEGFTGGGAARPALPEALTPREAEVLTLLAAGLTNKEIAQRLMLGSRTVETHVARVLGKLGVNTRARAVARALDLGLAAP